MNRTTPIASAFLLSCLMTVPLSAEQATTAQGQATSAERRLARFKAMDVNNDGVITRSEWRGNAQAFERHDINADGVLSGSEIWPAGAAPGVTGQGPGQSTGTSGAMTGDLSSNPLAQAFIQADENRDGIVSRAEWRSDPATFARVDVNGDGVITRPEFFGEGWRGQATAAASEPRPNSRAYQTGYDRGLVDGRQAGKEDKELRNQWDLEGQRELEQADAGYQASLGDRADYQAGYRAGFRAGYRQGFGPRK